MGKFYDEEGLLVAEGEFVDNVYRDVDKICHVDTGRLRRSKSVVASANSLTFLSC